MLGACSQGCGLGCVGGREGKGKREYVGSGGGASSGPFSTCHQWFFFFFFYQWFF